MDSGDVHEDEHDVAEEPTSPRQLPPDLPKSLDDRRTVLNIGAETEMYDAWQGGPTISVKKNLQKAEDILTIASKANHNS